MEIAMRRIYAALVLLFVAPLAHADVNVTGEGKVSAKPDVVYVTVGVVSIDLTARGALDANAVTMTKLFKTLASKGLPHDDMQTSEFTLVAHYDERKTT